MEFDALVQQVFGVHCCGVTKLNRRCDEKEKNINSLNEQGTIEQSREYKPPIPSSQSTQDFHERSFDKQARKIPHAFELKHSPRSSNPSKKISRGTSIRAYIAAENALVGSESYSASGNNFSTTPSPTSSDQALLAFADISPPKAHLNWHSVGTEPTLHSSVASRTNDGHWTSHHSHH
jgi:hypothetical protein